MDDAIRKKLWRKKKADVKELFRKHGITQFQDHLIRDQLSSVDLRNDIWALGFSTFHFWTVVFDEATRTYPLRHIHVNRCEGGARCDKCVSPEAHDFAQVYSDELYDRLPEDEINNCRWLWLWIDRQNWAPLDFNFTVEPRTHAHSQSPEIRFDNVVRIVESNKTANLGD